MMRDFPKRLQPPAPPGALLKRATELPQRRAVKAEPKGDDPDHLALIRQLPCLNCGLQPCGEAAHVKFACAVFGMHNMLGKRVHDHRALPLCGYDHRLNRDAQHKGNERLYWEALGINPYLVAQRLSQASGDFPRMQAIVIQAIAERDKK